MNKLLADEECDNFRRLPCSFNDMVREIYAAGMMHERQGGKFNVVEIGVIDAYRKRHPKATADEALEAVKALLPC